MVAERHRWKIHKTGYCEAILKPLLLSYLMDGVKDRAAARIGFVRGYNNPCLVGKKIPSRKVGIISMIAFDLYKVAKTVWVWRRTISSSHYCHSRSLHWNIRIRSLPVAGWQRH